LAIVPVFPEAAVKRVVKGVVPLLGWKMEPAGKAVGRGTTNADEGVAVNNTGTIDKSNGSLNIIMDLGVLSYRHVDSRHSIFWVSKRIARSI
jgi:hypothetical protein